MAKKQATAGYTANRLQKERESWNPHTPAMGWWMHEDEESLHFEAFIPKSLF